MNEAERRSVSILCQKQRLICLTSPDLNALSEKACQKTSLSILDTKAGCAVSAFANDPALLRRTERRDATLSQVRSADR
jgi:hypothetical protein